MGMLGLSIDGRGYYAFALRVKSAGADGAADESMSAPGTADYDSAYGTGLPGPANTASSSGQQADGADPKMCVYTAAVAEVTEDCAGDAEGTANVLCNAVDISGDDAAADKTTCEGTDATGGGKCVYIAAVTEVTESCHNSAGLAGDGTCGVAGNVVTAEACLDSAGAVDATNCGKKTNLVTGGGGAGANAANEAAAKAACEASNDGVAGDDTLCTYVPAATAAQAAV